MVFCSYVGICFGVEHHHMADCVLHLAWHTKDYKNWSQDHGLGRCVAPISEEVARVKWGCSRALTFGLYPP